MAKTKKEKPVKPILNADTDALSPNTTPPGDPLNEPLCSPDPEEAKQMLLHNTGIDGLLGVDKETLNELNKQIGDFENSTAGTPLPYFEGSSVKLPEGTKPEIIYHTPKPPVYGVTNTMEDAIDQQKEAGIPELKHYADPMSNKSTDELIHIIAGRQTDKIRERKVLRLLREKLQ